MIVEPVQARIMKLNVELGKDAPEELDLHIFKNDLTPDNDTVLGDFTEADFTGYAVENLNSANYTVAQGATTSDPVVANYSPVLTFASSANQASQDCYGYYLTRRTTGDLFHCERFTDGPYNITNNLDSFTVNPRVERDTADAVAEVN